MRNFSTSALVLSVRTAGESNRTATLLTPGEGILNATLYGGPKSRLRSLVSPMNSGTIWLYRDESKRSAKISDFRVEKSRISLRENLFKAFAADLAAEIAIRTHCAGNPGEVWTLLNGFLDGLEFFGEDQARAGLPRFLWRYVRLLGIEPDTSSCSQCGIRFGRGFFGGKNGGTGLSYRSGNKVFLDLRSGGFVCDDCAKSQVPQGDFPEDSVQASEGACEYLGLISTLSPKESRNTEAGDGVLGEAKAICVSIIEGAIGRRLATLEAAAGIL